MIKGVVFDLDDTLYPEIDYVKSGFKQVSDYLYNLYEKSYYEQLIGLFYANKTDVFNRLIKINNLSIKTEELITIYRNNIPELIFYNDVLPFLEFLKFKKIKTGIITDGRSEGQRAKLRSLSCDELFDKIIITDELGGIDFRKPHPKSYEIMANALKIDYTDMMYIGDNPAKDFEINKVYPITTTWIKRSGYVLYNNCIGCSNPDFIITSLQDLYGAFNNL